MAPCKDIGGGTRGIAPPTPGTGNSARSPDSSAPSYAVKPQVLLPAGHGVTAHPTWCSVSSSWSSSHCMARSFSSAHGVGKKVIFTPGQGATLMPLSRTLPPGCSQVGTWGPSRASAPPLTTGPSRVVHAPPPHIPPVPAHVPPCPPALSIGRGAEPQPPPLTLNYPCHCLCTFPTPVTVWRRREGQYWAAVTVTIRDRTTVPVALTCSASSQSGTGALPQHCALFVFMQAVWQYVFPNSLILPHLLHWETRGWELSSSKAGKLHGRRAGPSFQGADQGSCSAWYKQ